MNKQKIGIDTIENIDAFQCSDGEIFTSERIAQNRQENLALEAVDKRMKAFAEFNPTISYPNLKGTLIPYMCEHAKDLIKALSLAL